MLDIVPNGRAWVVDRQQQFGLGGDVFQVAHQGRAILTGLKVLMLRQILLRIKELWQLPLEFVAISWRVGLLGCHASTFPFVS